MVEFWFFFSILLVGLWGKLHCQGSKQALVPARIIRQTIPTRQQHRLR